MNPIEYNGLTNMYSYMAWQLITDPTSMQYKLREDAGQNFDSEGFGIIDNRYVIACCERYGAIGDYVNWQLADGTILRTVIGDQKRSSDPNNNGWGHVQGNYLGVVEFVVDYDTWYNPPHDNPGTNGFHEEWNGQLQGYENIGNYWTGYGADVEGSIVSITGKRYINGEVRNVYYIGAVQSDGYIYFNDDTFWRIYADKTNLQRFYIPKQIWIRTDDITDIQITSTSSHGGTPLPPGGSGVEDAVIWAIDIANDNSHGYDRVTRDDGTDFDCSSLVSWAFRENGFDIPLPSPATYTMKEPFIAAGFTWLEGIGNDSSQLFRGDILLNINDHVAIYLGNGQVVEALINEFGENTGGQPGDQTGMEICVRGYYSFPWDGVLRYGA